MKNLTVKFEDLQDSIESFLKELLPSGSGFDTGYDFNWTKQSLRISSSYHCMDDHGYYDGWADFTMIISFNKDIGYFKLQFDGKESQAKARKYCLRDCMENAIFDSLHISGSDSNCDESITDLTLKEMAEYQKGYIGLIEFQDNQGEYHDFELVETVSYILIGGCTNVGFYESCRYLKESHLSLDENLQECLADLKAYYNEDSSSDNLLITTECM